MTSQFELVDKDGDVVAKCATAAQAAETAFSLWPDQIQDEDRAGHGWDIQAIQPKELKNGN